MSRLRPFLALVLVIGCVDLTPPPPLDPNYHPGQGGSSPPPTDGPVLPDLRPSITDTAPPVDQAPPPDVEPADAPEQPEAGVDAADDAPAPPPDVNMPAPDMAPDLPPRFDDGKPCLQSDQCKSNFCMQGLCCNTQCNQACFACNLPQREGVCSPVPAGQSSPGECPKDDTTSCGHDGTCDGAGHCRLYPAGSECSKVSCTSNVEHAASSCDGMGKCIAGASSPCAPNS